MNAAPMKWLLSLFAVYALCLDVHAQTPLSVLRTKKILQTNIDLYTDTSGHRYKNPWIPATVITEVQIPDGTYYQYFLHDTARVATQMVYAGSMLVSYKTYWINDSLQTACKLVDGKVHGDWMSYDSSGHKIAEYAFVNGMHEEFTLYFPNGKIKRHAVMAGKKKTDYLWDIEDYYSNGQLKEKGRAQAQFKIGKWKYCDRDGVNCTTKRRRSEQVRAADWKE